MQQYTWKVYAGGEVAGSGPSFDALEAAQMAQGYAEAQGYEAYYWTVLDDNGLLIDQGEYKKPEEVVDTGGTGGETGQAGGSTGGETGGAGEAGVLQWRYRLTRNGQDTATSGYTYTDRESARDAADALVPPLATRTDDYTIWVEANIAGFAPSSYDRFKNISDSTTAAWKYTVWKADKVSEASGFTYLTKDGAKTAAEALVPAFDVRTEAWKIKVECNIVGYGGPYEWTLSPNAPDGGSGGGAGGGGGGGGGGNGEPADTTNMVALAASVMIGVAIVYLGYRLIVGMVK